MAKADKFREGVLFALALRQFANLDAHTATVVIRPSLLLTLSF
jgi:hypothetical protein